MALIEKVEWQQGGGVKRGEILVKTDVAISVTTTPTATPTVTVAGVLPKHTKFTVTALDASKAEVVGTVGIMGRAVSNGANPSVVTPYLWSTSALSVPINGFLKIAYEIPDGVNSD